MAQEYAEGCQFWHGQPDRDKDTMPYNQFGQNLYFNTAFINVTYANNRMFQVEKDRFDYETNACNGMCGHYTQVCEKGCI